MTCEDEGGTHFSSSLRHRAVRLFRRMLGKPPAQYQILWQLSSQSCGKPHSVGASLPYRKGSHWSQITLTRPWESSCGHLSACHYSLRNDRPQNITLSHLRAFAHAASSSLHSTGPVPYHCAGMCPGVTFLFARSTLNSSSSPRALSPRG